MIWHVVTFEWRPEVSAEQVEALVEALARFRAEIPVLVDYRYGPDLGLRENNGDFAIVAVLASADDLPAYLDDPAHHALVRDFIAPLSARRLAVQIAVDDA